MARQIVEKVIVIDDGSPDWMYEVKAYALLLGQERARDLGCKAAVTHDADGQHKTWEMPAVV